MFMTTRKVFIAIFRQGVPLISPHHDTELSPCSTLKLGKQRKNLQVLIVINVLKEIAEYQVWGQREKASAFERKFARKELKRKLKDLQDKKELKKVVDEEFSFIDFEKKKMKNCGESISFLAKSKEEFVKAVLTFFEVECRFKIDDCGTNY